MPPAVLTIAERSTLFEKVMTRSSAIEIPSLNLRVTRHGKVQDLDAFRFDHNIGMFYEQMTRILENIPYPEAMQYLDLEAQLASGKPVVLGEEKMFPEDAGYWAPYIQNPAKYLIHGYK